MKYYVNMNVDIRKGGRNAVKMSIEDFKIEAEHVMKEFALEQGLDLSYESNRRNDVKHFPYRCAYNHKDNAKSKFIFKLYNDIWNNKYKFDSENVERRGDVKMSKKGVPYLECYAGGDWECPVCFFIYFDGHHFRGYVPLKGNAICRTTKSAFQGDTEADGEEMQFIRKELNISKNEDCPLSSSDVDYNIDACLEDFLSRIEVKGSYKKKDYSKDDKKYDDAVKAAKEQKEREETEKEENVVRLSESELKSLIKESVREILLTL